VADDSSKLSVSDVVGSTLDLTRHFHRERLQLGLYGLYPKYRDHVAPLACYLGLQGHLLVSAYASLADPSLARLDVWQSHSQSVMGRGGKTTPGDNYTTVVSQA